MFRRWFRRGASAVALCVNESETVEGWLAEQEREAAKCSVQDNMDQTMILHRGQLAELRARITAEVTAAPAEVKPDAAELQATKARVEQLETFLRTQVIELERYRELAVKPATKARAPRKLATPKAVKVAKPVKLDALSFWQLHGQAVANIQTAFGERWDLAPRGQTELVTLPTKFRSYVNAKGVKVIQYRLLRVPAAEYWTDGALPCELATLPDPVRVTERGVNPVPHDAEWHRAHGYEWFKGVGKAAVVKNGVTTIQPIMAGWFHSMEMPAL